MKKFIMKLLFGQRYEIEQLIKEAKLNLVKLDQNILILETKCLVNPHLVELRVILDTFKDTRDFAKGMYNRMRKEYWITYGQKIF